MSEGVLVAVSGGVDSALAACLLKQSGHEVVAVTMQFTEEAETASARRVCEHLGVEHAVMDMRAVFEQNIVKYFLEEYSRGRTPNPCVLCNRIVKFATLCSHAPSCDCGAIATGHYARIERDEGGRCLLKRGIDAGKDQAYFLWALSQDQLCIADFPLGDKTKEEVRRIGKEIGISDLIAPESQNICFVKESSYHPFIRARIGRDLAPGPIRDTGGKVLGTHEGIELYTIGQRRGLGIAGGRPLYVVDIIPSENVVVLGEREDAMTARFSATNANWIAFPAPPAEFDALVKIRYAHPGAQAHVTVEQDRMTVEFEEPQFAVAPGQSAVFYDGDTVLGGATIDTRQ